jgi:biopolymer transport protein ExbD
MAMNFSSPAHEAQAIAEINTTPLIDVMLVLLVMLIISIPIQTNAVKLDMPLGKPPLAPPPVVLLQLEFDGTTLWNGNQVTDRATLDSYLTQAAKADPQPEIHLQADRLVKYDDVARVLADAQRLGVMRIGFINTDTYGER